MAFEIGRGPRRKLMLFPFMDIFFILLVFFIAMAALKVYPDQTTGADEVKTLPFVTPQKEVGEAHILVQLEGNGDILWFDCSSSELLRQYRGRVDRVREESRSEIGNLETKTEEYCDAVASCTGSMINVIIRCPDSLKYQDVLDVRQIMGEAIAGFVDNAGDRRLKAHFSLLCGSELRFFDRVSAGDTAVIMFAEP